MISSDNSYRGLKFLASPGVHPEAIEIIRHYLRPSMKVLELGAGAGAFFFGKDNFPGQTTKHMVIFIFTNKQNSNSID